MSAIGWTFARGPEGSRAVLSVIAGSMMTITSVTFSITIVALQLASSQFGPRLLRNFMRDRGNQVAIGTFIATFTYCLLVLRTVNGTEAEPFVPHVSVTVGLLLSLASLGVLIYFIHHAAESIQAENVVAAVSLDLHEAIDRLYPRKLGRGAGQVPEGARERELPDDFARGSVPIAAPRSDYLQAIDVDLLMQLGLEYDLILKVGERPGKFFIEGGELARVWPADRVDGDVADEIREAFYFGPRRSLTQDVEFAIDQLVEVAVRALSPGINDPFTAMNCVDRLGAALCKLDERQIPSPYRHDDEGRLRVVAETSTIDGIVDAAFHQIRQAARGDTAVTIKLLETIGAVGRHVRKPELREALRRHAEAVHRSAEALNDPLDRREAERRYLETLGALEQPPAVEGA